jgi:hypothetical protein
MPQQDESFGDDEFETDAGDVGPGYYDAQDEPVFRGRDPLRVENAAYGFGLMMAREERYRSRDWEAIEDEVKRTWDQTHPGQEWRANMQDILSGWADGLLGPDPEGAYGVRGTTGTEAGFDSVAEHGSSVIDLDALRGDAPLGDLGDTIRIVSADELRGKIDMHYVDDMDDLSDLPDIEDEGNRGDDIAHLE